MERPENETKYTKSHCVQYFFRSVWALTNRDLKKWYLAPVVLIVSLIQPVVWLGLFGKSFNLSNIFSGGSFSIPGVNIPANILNNLGSTLLQNTFGTTSYFSFLAVGMLAFIVIFTTMFSGFSVVWDRRFGVLDKLLTTPVSRGAIVLGKIFNSVIRGLVQAAIVLVIAVILGMSLGAISVSGIVLTFIALFLLAFGMSALFVVLALRSTDWQSQMAIANLLSLPLLFLSNAFFPTSAMPSWLAAIANANPISFTIEIGRSALLGITPALSIGYNFLFLGLFAGILGAISIVLSLRLLKG